MKRIPVICTTLIALACTPAWAACTQPEVPGIPDGATAAKDAFYAGYQAAKDYLKAGDEYLACLTSEEEAEVKAGKATEETQAARLELYNNTVDEMQKLGEELNAEVGEFKARTDLQ